MSKKRKFHVIFSGMMIIMSLIIIFALSHKKSLVLGNSKNELVASAEITVDHTKTSDGDYPADASIEEVIQGVMAEFNVLDDQVSIVYESLKKGNDYRLNEDDLVTAASTIKVGIAAIFVDQIVAGNLTWDSELPYYDSYYESGDGAITNSEKQYAYTVEELIDQMLTYSDNTATNILAFYYRDTFSDYRQAILDFSGETDIPLEAFENNETTADILAAILKRLTEDERYQPIIDVMLQAQDGFRLKQYVTTGMAAKYGSYGAWQHDTGIYYEDEEAVYLLVVLTYGLENVDEFMGELNYQIKEWQQLQ